MHQSKLIMVLRKLSTRQLSRFGAFLQSPYFNKNTENNLFFDFLNAFAPGFDEYWVGESRCYAGRSTG